MQVQQKDNRYTNLICLVLFWKDKTVRVDNNKNKQILWMLFKMKMEFAASSQWKNGIRINAINKDTVPKIR